MPDLIEESLPLLEGKAKRHPGTMFTTQWALALGFFNVGFGLTFLVTPMVHELVGQHEVSSVALNTYRCCIRTH